MKAGCEAWLAWPGEGQGAALLQEFPGIVLQRRPSGSRAGLQGLQPTAPRPLLRRPGPGSASPAYTDPVRRGRAAPRGHCYGGAAPAASRRRVSAAPGDRRSSSTPRHCRVRAGPGRPRRNSPSPPGGRRVSPPPSRLRAASGPCGCGVAPAPRDRLVPVARGGRCVSQAAGSCRLPVASSDRRDPSAARDCGVSTGPGGRGGSGLGAVLGRPSRPRAR